MIAMIIGIIVGVAVAALLFKPMFGDRHEFFRCVKFWLTPDIVSLFRAQYGEDWISELKLGLWIGAGGLCGFGAYIGLVKILG